MEPLTSSAGRGDRARPTQFVGAVVPVLDEAEAIADVVTGLLANGVDDVVVVDGGSVDDTVLRSRSAGAMVVVELRRGYGRAMMTGLAALDPRCGIVLFFDGDGSDRTGLLPEVLRPVLDGTADFVMGSRLRGEREAGSLGISQVVAGCLAGMLLRLFYGVPTTDMSPFRAIRRDTLSALGMRETTFGWNLEMQIRAAVSGLRIVEVPVGQRRRQGGVSKVSGDWRNGLRAAWVIATTFVRLTWRLRHDR
jgi:glycosyltransferase involved in cell wall biosynthesis